MKFNSIFESFREKKDLQMICLWGWWRGILLCLWFDPRMLQRSSIPLIVYWQVFLWRILTVLDVRAQSFHCHARPSSTYGKRNKFVQNAYKSKIWAVSATQALFTVSENLLLFLWKWSVTSLKTTHFLLKK